MGVMRLLLDYGLCFGTTAMISHLLSTFTPSSSHKSVHVLIGGYLLTYLVAPYKTEGYASCWFQKLPIWKYLMRYFSGSITVEEPLDPQKQYIFCAFPHGCCTVNHGLTMTDACGMLSQVYPGNRRDLAASVLFFIPVIREILLLWGNVDAGGATAHYNLKKSRSLMIFVGGEKEQLLTQPHHHQIVVRERKGFIKLSLQYGCPLVPMYCFGENELYFVSDFLLDFRKYLQHNFQIGIPICFGVFGTLIPYKVALNVEIGRPIPVEKIAKDKITQQNIDDLHQLFMLEMERLFERTKSKYGVPEDVKLTII